MEDGRYAVYNSQTFRASIDGESKKINLYSRCKFSPEFTVSKLKGYYSLAVDKIEISEAYELKTYGVLGNDRFYIVGKVNDKVILCTYDAGLAKAHSFERHDYSEYRKVVVDCKFIQVKKRIWND